MLDVNWVITPAVAIFKGEKSLCFGILLCYYSTLVEQVPF